MLKPRKPELPPAPRHLRLATRAWWNNVVANFELDQHHTRLLQLAAESWDRGLQAKEALKTGLTYVDRWGSPRARPEVQIERDSRISFARLIRELDLDGAIAPPSSRPPALNSNRR